MAPHTNEMRQSQAAAEFQDLLREGQEEKITQLTTMANHNEVRQSQAAAEFQDLLQEGQEEKFTQLTTMAPHNKMRQSQAAAELHKTFLPAAQTLVPGKHFP